MQRLWLALMSVAVMAAVGAPQPAEAAGSFCRLNGSKCTDGQQCCSEICEYEGGDHGHCEGEN